MFMTLVPFNLTAGGSLYVPFGFGPILADLPAAEPNPDGTPSSPTCEFICDYGRWTINGTAAEAAVRLRTAPAN
jgi:hypothetical protein